LSVRLDVPIMGWGNPIGLGIGSFAQWDLEVGVHGVADIPIWSSFVSLGIPFDSRLKSLDPVFESEHGKAVDFFVILDGLDQTGCDLLESGRVNIGVGGKYVFHSTRGVAGWG